MKTEQLLLPRSLTETESMHGTPCQSWPDYNLTLCPLQSRLQHIYYGLPDARVDLNPMPESTFLNPQVGDFGFSLSSTGYLPVPGSIEWLIEN